jgi:pimeloyl-ACP methyl ester carboxylesterase
MHGIHHRYADVNGQRLFYREAGVAGAPAPVLLHGFPTSSFMFRDLIPLLAERYRVIAPDHLGFGLSDAPPAGEFGYTVDALAGLTAGLLGKLGVTRYAMYIQDYGARAGWRLALADPEAISAIITQNGNGYEAGFADGFRAPVREYWRNRNCSRTMPATSRCIRSRTPTCVTAASRCWASGAGTTRFSALRARSPSPATRPAPRSACSTAATSCWKATCARWRAPSAASWKGAVDGGGCGARRLT